jgi:hypothetical protein
MIVRNLFLLGFALLELGAFAMLLDGQPLGSNKALALDEERLSSGPANSNGLASASLLLGATPTPACIGSWTLVSSENVANYNSYCSE